MKKSRLFTILLMGTALLALSSCMSTKFVMDPNLPKETKRALLTGFSVNLELENEDSSLLGVAVDAFGTRDLGEFGMEAERSLIRYLDRKSFYIFKDSAMAKRADLLFNMGDKATLAGIWVHPETSAYTSNYFTGLTIGFNKKKYLAKVKGDSDLEYFAYGDVRIYKASTFGIFGGYPRVVFNVAIVDPQGKVVLQARAYGNGKKQFLGINLSKENLSLAFEKALISLDEL